MKCPSCNKQFSYWDSFKIVNPLNYQCPNCKSLLTTGKIGVVMALFAIIIGISIAVVGIGFERKGLWSHDDSVLWYVLTIAVGIPVFQYIAWKSCTFRTK